MASLFKETAVTSIYPPEGYPSDLDAFLRQTFERATLFTAFVHVNPWDRRRCEADTFEGAVEQGTALSAETGKSALIYAVSPDGRQVLAGHVSPRGLFTFTIPAAA